MSVGEILYLSHEDVEAVGIEMRAVIGALEEMFQEKGEGHVEMPPKPGIHTRPDAFIHAMPAYIPALESAGMKWVSGYPENERRGLPYITGLLILNDPETGLPLSVMDCVWITAQRTGAATAVAAKYLARPDSSVVGILGCGVQGRSNLQALDVLFEIREVRAYDTNPEAAQAYAAHVTRRYPFAPRVVQEPRAAVSGCDIVVTAGPILREPHATIRSGWMDPGSFASLVDFDSYFSAGALQSADKFCTDDRMQLQHYQKEGYFQHIPAVHADLGELAVGAKPGRERPEEITMAANLGLALDDIAVAPLIFSAAKERGLGTWLPL
jgi:ornithine cyclodeaminase/alanine dehydrogenase